MLSHNDIARPQISADETKEYPLAPVSGGDTDEAGIQRQETRHTWAAAGWKQLGQETELKMAYEDIS